MNISPEYLNSISYRDEIGRLFVLCHAIGYSKFNPSWNLKEVEFSKAIVEMESLKFPIPSSKYTIHHRKNDFENNELENLFILTRAEDTQVQELILLIEKEDTIKDQLYIFLYDTIQTLGMANIHKLKWNNFLSTDNCFEELKKRINVFQEQKYSHLDDEFDFGSEDGFYSDYRRDVPREDVPIIKI